MKQLTDTYKVYRELPLFESLLESLEELGSKGLIPMELIPRVVHQYDLTVAKVVRESTEQYLVSGQIKAFRIFKDFWWIMMENVMIQKPKIPKNKTKVKSTFSSSKAKGEEMKSRSLQSHRIRKLKILCHEEVNGNNIIATKIASPYAVEVEQKVKKKKEKPKLKTMKELLKREKDQDVYDPRAHSTGVNSQGSNNDFLRPMPYNEKLRRGGRENSLAIAETQLSAREVLKGRYRRCSREYPYRRLSSEGQRRRMDESSISIPSSVLTGRIYRVLFTTEDRELAELAERAGRPEYERCLNLKGHNVHVVPVSMEERKEYSTRRKHMIEDASYNISNGYRKVKLLKVENDPSSDSSDDQENSPSPSVEEKKPDLVRTSSRSIILKAGKKDYRNCLKGEDSTDEDDMFDQPIEVSNIKLEPREEEEVNDVDNYHHAVLGSLLEVEPTIKVEDREMNYQCQDGLDELEEFLNKEGKEDQTEPETQVSPQEVDAVLDGLMDEFQVRPDSGDSQDNQDLWSCIN